MLPVDLVGLGLNATDTVLPVPAYPASGSKVEIESPQILLGGQVASAVVACQTWGLRTRYIGKVGDDPAALFHRAEFARTGVSAELLTAPGALSHQSFILVDPAGERTVLWKRDDRLTIRPEELRREWLSGCRALHLDGRDTEAAALAARWAGEERIPVVADLDDLYPGIESLLPRIDFLITSRNIPPRLAGTADMRLALPAIQARYGNRLTAATLGQDGVLAWDGAAFHYAPAYDVPTRDTTGAGDIFHAAFIYGLLHAWPLAEQLDFACAAAALNCTALGARGKIAPLAEIRAFAASAGRRRSVFT